jgi:hypothetical protein
MRVLLAVRKGDSDGEYSASDGVFASRDKYAVLDGLLGQRS